MGVALVAKQKPQKIHHNPRMELLAELLINMLQGIPQKKEWQISDSLMIYSLLSVNFVSREIVIIKITKLRLSFEIITLIE